MARPAGPRARTPRHEPWDLAGRRCTPGGPARATAWALALAVLAPGGLAGQYLQGVTLYTTWDSPISFATIELMDVNQVVVALATTGVDGRFAVPVPEEGIFYVRVSHLSAETYVDGPVELSPTRNTLITFHLDPKPVLLDSLAVAVERTSIALTRVGFYERQKLWPGTFLDERTIAERSPISASDLLRVIPGVQVMESGTGLPFRAVITRYALRNTLQNRPPCFPRIYVDDVLIEQGGSEPPSQDFDRIVPVSQLSGLEVYDSPADVPPQYGQGRCGVILMWTKR
ncbi:MAG: TonB-dependent receptor [Gemmatimonadota bacterium]